MSLEVVKVQVALIPKDAPALIYPNASRDKRTTQQRLDESAKRALGSDVKGYFKASFVDGKWKLGRRLPDQGW